jgi:hypothetical protein
MAVGIPMLLGLFYFIVTRKDRTKFENRTNVRSDEEAEQDKQELARKVKKELADEADKVEKIRKDVAIDVKEETNRLTDQKLREQKAEFTHQLEMYEQRSESRFTASDKVMEDLMAKMVDISKIQADAILKINESIESLRKLFYEISGKVSRAERDITTKMNKEHD